MEIFNTTTNETVELNFVDILTGEDCTNDVFFGCDDGVWNEDESRYEWGNDEQEWWLDFAERSEKANEALSNLIDSLEYEEAEKAKIEYSEGRTQINEMNDEPEFAQMFVANWGE